MHFNYYGKVERVKIKQYSSEELGSYSLWKEIRCSSSSFVGLSMFKPYVYIFRVFTPLGGGGRILGEQE